MKSNTFCVDFMVKLIRRLSGNLIYYLLSIKIPDNLKTNFANKISIKSISTLSIYKLHTNRSGN